MVDAFSELLRRLGLGLADFVLLFARLRDALVWQGTALDVTLAAGTTQVTVSHGLGRTHQGAFVVLASAPVPLFALAATDSFYLTLVTGSAVGTDVSYRVWVYA